MKTGQQCETVCIRIVEDDDRDVLGKKYTKYYVQGNHDSH